MFLHYRVVDKIGSGGMGEVFKAEDTKLGRTVALKVLPTKANDDTNAKRRFLKEAQAASALNHPNIVTIHAIEEVDGLDFIVMEYIEGETLKACVERCGALPLTTLLDIGIHVADALQAAHAPQMTMRINARMFGFIPAPILYGLGSLSPVKRMMRAVLKDLGIPQDVFSFVNSPTRYDNREAAKALKGSGIAVPELESYAAKIWDYWERHLDPEALTEPNLRGVLEGKVAIVTGASSGIGRAVAARMARHGARVMLVARSSRS